MGQRSDSRTVGLSLALFVVATNSFAQAPNRATRYLFPTDVTDARALWVNPAGLGAFPEASINLDVTVGDPGSSGKLRQLTFAFNSRGLSAGYQRDIYSDGQHGHTYKLGLATGQGGFEAGLNDPFAGGHVIERHASPGAGIQALQIEIDRRCYLDETMHAPGPGFDQAASLIETVAVGLGEALLRQPFATAAE